MQKNEMQNSPNKKPNVDLPSADDVEVITDIIDSKSIGRIELV